MGLILKSLSALVKQGFQDVRQSKDSLFVQSFNKNSFYFIDKRLKVDLHYSLDNVLCNDRRFSSSDEFSKKLRTVAHGVLKDFYENSCQEIIINNYAKSCNNNNLAILSAHGGQEDDIWSYYCNHVSKSVQSWVDANDGLYSTLIISSCNESDSKIVSKKSMLIYFGDIYSQQNFLELPSRLRIYIPSEGHINPHEGQPDRIGCSNSHFCWD